MSTYAFNWISTSERAASEQEEEEEEKKKEEEEVGGNARDFNSPHLFY